MDRTRRSLRPSKSEVALRFVACTGLALALYYTAELKWSPDASAYLAAQADAMLAAAASEATVDACASMDSRDLPFDAAMKAN